MASNKFFTNTYITGTGRQNYLRADYLEDPLFTSFTFDIDFISSPLFYTINNYTYPHPDDIGISEQIQNALGEMRKKMMPDQGYDILPLYSAEFLKGDKLGFGLQQNVYMDLPLYGATEYIYMVDKRNGDGSQSDVRYDDNSGSANNGGFKSYKLGDSVKEAVSESDKAWADTQNAQAAAQIADCNNIMAPGGKADKEHKSNKTNMDKCERTYKDIKIKVHGIDGEFSEEELQNEINKLRKVETRFEQLKKNIANWVNDKLSSWQGKIKKIYDEFPCVKKVASYHDSTTDAAKNEMNKLYGKDWPVRYVWKKEEQDQKDRFMSKCLYEYNSFITYTSPSSSFYKKDDNNSSSFLVDMKTGDNMSTVRPSVIQANADFSKDLEELGLMEKDKDGKNVFKKNIKVILSKDEPEWTNNVPDRLSYWVGRDILPEGVVHTVVVEPTMYKCDVGTCFDEFDSEVYTKNHDELGRYEDALDNIRAKIYGYGEGCDANNPDPDSPYGQYLAAKEKYENDAYSQAEKTKSIAQSGVVNTTVVPDSEKNNLNNNTNGSAPSTIQQSSSETQKKPIVTPQTVLDMLGFISGMKKMTTEYPYIINGVTGLDKAYETHYGVKDPYMGSGDNKISLTCWESLDLRVTTMFNRYFNAVYDRQYRRERVPVNLRRFNCSIYVHDVRNFVTNNSKGQYENRMLELTDMYYSAIEFKFYDCEIVPEETGNIFNDISNEAPTEMKKTNFTFTYGNCVVNFVPQSEVAKYR